MSNIVIDCERMKYPFTGLYYFCLHLGNSLQRLQQNDELFFFLPPSVDKGVFAGKVPSIPQNSFQKFFFPATSPFDLWHCTYQGSNYFPRSKKIKIVLTVHDLNFLHDPDKSQQKKAKYLKSLAKKVERANAVVAISEYVKKELQTYLTIADEKLYVVYNGCTILPDIKPAAPAKAIKKPFLFTIGTIAAKKNFHVLPAALLNNDFHLVIAGVMQDADYYQKIKAKAEELGVSDRVFYIGTVSEEEKYWLLKNCSLFLFPSVAEGFGLPVIEAMYFGKPVLLSTKTSLPEVGGPHAGYLQNFDDAHISEMCSKTIREFTQQKEAASKAWAAQFSWENAAKAYWEIYKKIGNG